MAIKLRLLNPGADARSAQIIQALSEQTVVVLGTQAATIVLPRLAQQLAALRRQRDDVAGEVEQRVLAHPLHPVLTSMLESASGPPPGS